MFLKKELPFIILILLMLISYHYGKNSYYPSIKEKTTITISNSFTENVNSFKVIFINNWTIAILILVLGYLTGGIIAYIIVIWNAYLFGALMNETFHKYENYSEFISFHILPHGIIEVIAFLLFARIALKGKYFTYYFKHSFTENLPDKKVLLLPSLLLTLAAFIEAFISSTQK